jgi:hypothetical protein
MNLFRYIVNTRRDHDRMHFWPIRLLWSDPTARKWFGVHGWQTGTEPSDVTGFGCMPGYRRTLGWTYHLGRLKLCFGPKRA